MIFREWKIEFSIMLDRYLSEVSKPEVKYILSAFERLISRLPNNDELCSHTQVSNLLFSQFSIYKKGKICWISLSLVNSLNRNFIDITINDPVLWSLIREFWKYFESEYTSEKILWCAWLLANYHRKEECSEYLTLALKFNLAAYFEFVEYSCCHKVPPDVMEIRMEFLWYIAYYKCKHVLFTSYLNAFFEYNEFDFKPVLTHVLDAAHELRFNFFRLWDKDCIFVKLKYIQKSKYSYQDQRYSRAFFYYDTHISINDSDNLFGFQRRIVRRRSNKKYRPYQVLYLYIKAYYAESEFDQKLHEEVLRVLWKSISDPFLSQKQFLSSFEQYDKFPEFLEVWKWYAKIVLNDAESVKASRSLKHLTRCAIRKILTESVQMPFGINSLSIPSTLKSYLRLEKQIHSKEWFEGILCDFWKQIPGPCLLQTQFLSSLEQSI